MMIPLLVCCLNVQSLKNRAIPIVDNDVAQSIDVVMLTEAWLGTDADQLTINELILVAYEFNHNP